ncbi:DUF2059 domain-containing protein [Thermaurantiacus sp.]
MKVLIPPLALLALAAPAAAEQARAVATALVDLLAPPARQQAELDRQLAEMRKGAAIRGLLGQNPRFRMEEARKQPAFEAGLQRMGAIQAEALGPILKEMVPAQRELTIAAYARNFTEAELNAIAAFYRSPAGAKFARLQPQVAIEVGRGMAQRFGPRIETAQKSIAPRLDAELRKLLPPEPKG